MRKMATIRKIDELRPIVGADAIECAIVGGWTCVVKKGEYNVGDLAVYLEIDSWVPNELAPFLSKGKEHQRRTPAYCQAAWSVVTGLAVVSWCSSCQ